VSPVQPPLFEDGISQDPVTRIISLHRIVPQTTAVGYGVDLKCVDDLDPALGTTDPFDIATLGQAAYHAITTRRLTLCDDKDYGIDVAAYLHAPKLPADLQALGGQVATELQKDDRIQAAACVASFDSAERELSLSVRITPSDPSQQSFSLIVAVTDGGTLLQEVTS
jgi:hypothetical protein